MTPPLQTCTNALEINGVAILPQHSNEIEGNTTTDILHMELDPAREECKISPDKSEHITRIIQKMETLFEIPEIEIQDNEKYLNVSPDGKNTHYHDANGSASPGFRFL